MSTITVDATYQGWIQNSDFESNQNWSDIRNSSSGTFAQTITTATTTGAILAGAEPARSDVALFMNRTYLFFDLDSVTELSGKTITAITLKVLGAGSNNNADTIIIPASAWGGDGSTSTLSDSDFGNVTFGSGNTYSSEKTTWTTSGYNDYTLNDRAIEDANEIQAVGIGGVTRRLNLAIVEHDYDFSNVAPIDDSSFPFTYTTVQNDVRFLDSTNKIKLEITYEDDGIEAVNAVKKANIDKILGYAEIGKIIDIDF